MLVIILYVIIFNYIALYFKKNIMIKPFVNKVYK